MKYLKHFKSHESYSISDIKIRPCIVWDEEHLHILVDDEEEISSGDSKDEEEEETVSTPIAKFIVANNGISIIGYSRDIYEYSDIDVNTSEVTDECYMPYMIYSNSGDSFSIMVSMDGVESYKLSTEKGSYELNDDLLESLGGESSVLYSYKGQYLVVPSGKSYGIIYDGKSYWYSGNGSVFNDADAASSSDGSQMTHYYTYKNSDDGSELRLSISQSDLKGYSEGTELSVVLYTVGTLVLESSEDIDVVVTSKF